MERRVIDMEKDPRREQFQLFSGYSFPYAGVTVQLDVTALELRLRAEHKPIFLTMLYVIHRAVNRVPELRRRIEDGQVVEYDECPVSFTEMKPDGSYARVKPKEGERRIDSQMMMYNYFANNWQVTAPAAAARRCAPAAPKQGFLARLLGAFGKG